MKNVKSKIENFNNLDKSSWDVVRFGDVVREAKETSKDHKANDIEHVIGLEHLSPLDIHIRTWGAASDGKTFTKKFSKGQVLFGRRRAYQRKAALADFGGVCSGDIIVMEAIKDKLDSRLLTFLVYSESFYDWAVSTSAGSLSPRTKFKSLAEYELQIPPMEMQKELADLLWAVDEVEEKTIVLMGKEGQLYASLLGRLFSDNLPMKKLIDIAKIVMGQSPPGSSYNTESGTPFLQGNSEFKDEFPVHTKYTTQPGRMASIGDILMSVRAPIGAINIADKKYCIGRGLCAIRSNINDYIKHMLFYLRPELERRGTGSTFKAINKDGVQDILIPFVSEKEALIFSKRLNSVEKIIKDSKKYLNETGFLKMSIINSIF